MVQRPARQDLAQGRQSTAIKYINTGCLPCVDISRQRTLEQFIQLQEELNINIIMFCMYTKRTHVVHVKLFSFNTMIYS